MFNSRVELKLWARPTRVSFVLPETSDWSSLAQILLFSFGRWGGRGTSIIPSQETNDIAVPWWRLLAASDADVIYSLTKFSEDKYDRIFQELYPAQVWDDASLKNEIRDHNTYANRIPGKGLLAFAQYLRQLKRTEEIPLCISWERLEDDTMQRFCLNNFGALPQSTFTAIYPECRMLDEYRNPVSLIQEICSIEGDPLLPSDLCSVGIGLHCNTEEDEPFEKGFHVVVGETLHESIYCWNRRMIAKPFQFRDTFWLPPSLMDNTKLLGWLAVWFRQRFFCTGQSTHKVVTYSVDEQQIAILAAQLSELTGERFETFRLKQNEFPFADHIQQRSYIGEEPLVASAGSRRQDFHTDTIPIPRLLRSTDPDQGGGWMVDIEFESPQDGLNNIRYSDTWAPPQRYTTAELFIGPGRSTRITSQRLLSVAVHGRDRNISLRFPSIKKLFGVLLQERRSVISGDVQFRRVARETFSIIADSDSGKYAQSILQMFGSLPEFDEILSDKCWQEIFAHMMGNGLESQVSKLLRNLTGETENFSGAAKKITQQLLRYKAQSEHLSLTRADQIWSKQYKSVTGDSPTSEEKLDLFRARLDWLLERKILLQGSSLTCDFCGRTDWIVVDRLSSDMTCNGCLQRFSLPMIEMSLGLNSLVFFAFRIQGVYNVCRSLNLLRQQSRQSFLFLPCQNIFETSNSETPFTDLDLAVIMDGKLVIGEVKSGVAGVRRLCEDEKIPQLVSVLRPDKFVVAAPASAITSEASQLEVLERRLNTYEVPLQRLPLPPSAILQRLEEPS